MECQICNKSFKVNHWLSRHIKSHPITHQEYYDKFILKNENREITEETCKK